MITVNGKRIQETHFVWINQDENLNYIPEGFIIHHLNGDGNDNVPFNLILMPDIFHRSLHMKIIKQLKMEV